MKDNPLFKTDPEILKSEKSLTLLDRIYWAYYIHLPFYLMTTGEAFVLRMCQFFFSVMRFYIKGNTNNCRSDHVFILIIYCVRRWGLLACFYLFALWQNLLLHHGRGLVANCQTALPNHFQKLLFLY